MVRGGRGYSSRGGSGRGSYRSSNRSYPYNRVQSNRRAEGFSDNYSGSSSSRYNSNYSNYESRNRDKFQSKYNDNRADSHKRYRDSSRDRTDDRKRSRQDDSRVNSTYSSSSTPANYRRTNDSSSRNRASSPAGSYHRSSGSGANSYRGRRDGSNSRRHISNNDVMGPPKRTIRSSLVVRPRGGGTLSSSRGMRGSTSMRGGIRIIRKESADIRMMRKKLFYAQQKDRARLLKIARLTSSLRRRKVSRRSSSPISRNRSRGTGSANNDKKASDEEEWHDSEDDAKKEKKKTSEKTKAGNKSDDDDDDDDDDKQSVEDEEENNKSKDKSISNKKSQESSTAAVDAEVSSTPDVAKSEERASSPASIKKENDDDDETEKKNRDDDGKKLVSKKSRLNTDSNIRSKDKKSDDSEEASPKKKESKEYRSRHERSTPGKFGNKFIKLTCPHCHLKFVTFKEYYNHLFSRTHKVAMRNISLRQKAHLQRLRQQQRNAQREIEEKSKDEFDELKPKFCLLCRLNYRQPKAKHQLSEHHKTMKKFLMPYCSTCHLAFKSPMLYEAHRCSLEHIKRKARNNESESEESRNEMREIDLNKFMTVDSVGEIDDIAADDGEESENAIVDGVEDDDDDDEDRKDRFPVGAKFVKKIEAIFCELCRCYSACSDNEDSSIRKHCLSRNHLKAFIRYKEEKAETEVKDEADDATGNGEVKVKDDSPNDECVPDGKEHQVGEENAAPEADDVEEGEDQGEDKLWEDVDKDLGDLLREVGPDGQDEDDEEEDESVLNIDIESEKSKIKEIVNGKKEDHIVNNNQKKKEETTESEETISNAKPKTPRIVKEKTTTAKTESNVQSKVTVASKIVSKSPSVKSSKTSIKASAVTRGGSVKLSKPAPASKSVAKVEEKERPSLEEKSADD